MSVEDHPEAPVCSNSWTILVYITRVLSAFCLLTVLKLSQDLIFSFVEWFNNNMHADNQYVHEYVC